MSNISDLRGGGALTQEEAFARKQSEDLKTGGGGGTFDGMESSIPQRLSYLEGGFSATKAALYTIAGVLIAAMALIVSLQIYSMGKIDSSRTDLGNRIEALNTSVARLPGEVNRNLIELNQTLSNAIVAARSGESPNVYIQLPREHQTNNSGGPMDYYLPYSPQQE